MSIRHTRRPIVESLAAALCAYERDVTALIAAWPHEALYDEVCAGLDEIKALSSMAPALMGPTVALLVTHFDLLQGLWREPSAPERGAAIERHAKAVALLQGRCKDFLANL